MNIRNRMFLVLFALSAFFPLTFVSGEVRAQQHSSSYAAPRIGGFDVEQVRRLVPGTELNFTLYGTPGAIAIVSIPGGTGRLLMEEMETGLYMGSYTIKTRDQVAPDAAVTANLRLGNQVATVVLDEPLIAPAKTAKTSARRMTETASVGTDPRIDGFDVVPNQLVSGSDLIFALYGTPGGRASIRIAGVAGRIFLEETQDGVYE